MSKHGLIYCTKCGVYIGKERIQANTMCTECMRKYKKQYYIEHKEEIKERVLINYHNNPKFRFLGKIYSLNRHPPVLEGYVYHHTCYDRADPEANLIMMRRTDYISLHNTMRREGTKIPHINTVKKYD